jgi:hypothetical protein
MARFNSDRFNPSKIAMTVDNGFTTYCNDGTDGRPVVLRPLSSTDRLPKRVDEATARFRDEAERLSAWVTTARQHGEWINGALKRGFPRLFMPMDANDLPRMKRDLTLVVHLFNFRTRFCGWNQVRNVYVPHIHERFAEQGLTYDEVTGMVAVLPVAGQAAQVAA